MSETVTARESAEWPVSEEGFWVWDRMHYPSAVTPMTASIDGPAFERGFKRASNELSLPIAGAQVRFFHHYWYFSVLPFEGDLAARVQGTAAAMARRQPLAHAIYRNEIRPEIDAINDKLRTFSYDGARDAELAQFLRRAVELRARIWELHFLATQPAVAAAGAFLDLYEQRFGRATERHDLAVLQGFPNATMELAGALRRLATQPHASAVVAEMLRTTSPDEVRDALGASQDGRSFLQALDAFLDQHGRHTGSTDFIAPSWVEDERPLLRILQLSAKTGAQDPAEAQLRAARERDEAKTTLLGTLEPAERVEFERALLGAQQCLPVLEDHARVIDEMNTALMRLPLVEAGRRLARGDALTDQRDVFFLTFDEVADALREPTDLHRLAEERHADFMHWRDAEPPPFIGRPPSDTSPDPTMSRFFGFGVRPSDDPYLVTGRPASRGTVTAPARILHGLADSEHLQPGEILVCETTTPAWTPLFGVVAGLITDTGGELSHAAMVAREYGIPCVVGTGDATRVIAEGDEITVDGLAGTVRLPRPRA